MHTATFSTVTIKRSFTKPMLFWWFRKSTAQNPNEALQSVEQLPMLYQHSLHHQLPWRNLEHSKISCLSCSFAIFKFFHECAEVVIETDDCPSSSLYFQINFIELLKYVNKICQAENQMVIFKTGYYSFVSWSLRIDCNCYILLDPCTWVAHCITCKLDTTGCVHLSLLSYILNLA